MGEVGSPDPAELPGPWQHRHVAANGARFHVALAGPESGPMVLLLHGFGQFWWAWRHQIPELADSGRRVVALDLRGYGGSDTTPRGYDPMTLAQDVVSVVQALGARDATVVGHGWGGYVGWAAAAMHPGQVTRLCAVSAPHPLAMLRSFTAPAVRHLLAMQVPLLPERRLVRGGAARHLRSWGLPATEALATYQAIMQRWPSPHCALEYHRWLLRSRMRADGRAFNRAMRHPLQQPVLCVLGSEDRVVDAAAMRRSARFVAEPLVVRRMEGVAHYPAEEEPDAFTGLLMDWLQQT